MTETKAAKMHTNRQRDRGFSRNVLMLCVLHVALQCQGSGAAITANANIADPAANGTAGSNPPAAAPGPAPAPAPRIPVPRVKLNKCCHFGEYLNATQACVAGSSDHWVPLIYQINRQRYYAPQGKFPSFMSFVPNTRPVLAHHHQATLSNALPADAPAMSAEVEVDDGCTAEELELFTGSANILLFSNGSLYLREHDLVVEPRRYCVDRESALVCLPKTMQRDLKLYKCCGKYGSYDATAKACTFAVTNKMGKLQLDIDESLYQTLYVFPKCPSANTPYAIAGDWADAHLNTSTGQLTVDHKNFSSSDYCLEHLREGSSISAKVKIFTCLHHYAPSAAADAPANAMAPSAGTEVTSDRIQVAALNFGIVVSVVFLAATLVASYLMPSVHHVLHWRCQIYYVFCLFVGDLLLAYTQLSSHLQWGSFMCLLLASAMHFFFLSAFFWLNTMCFNIWWTFRDFRPSSLERNQELLRLRLYSAYAWGIPMLICLIAACVDQLNDKDLLRPGFGVRNCWFSGEDLSILAYFFGPIGILLCANIVLFISTTHQLTCGLWKRDDVKSTTEKTALGKVCLKLVVVMGVTWIADIISWVIGGPHSVWFFTDLINALQGVFIFIVVGCQPQVWAACKRFCCPRSRQEITNTTNGVQHSSSSQGLPSLAACGAEITQNTSINTTIGGGCTGTTTGISTGSGGLHVGAATANTPGKIPMETVC